VPRELTPAQQSHVLGAQANLWTEHLRTNERVQRAAFPRAAALAEATWTPAARRDWNSFLQRLAPMRARWLAADFQAADSGFAVRIAAAPAPSGAASVILSNQTGFGTIRYTTDGTAPTPQSPAYAARCNCRCARSCSPPTRSPRSRAGRAARVATRRPQPACARQPGAALVQGRPDPAHGRRCPPRWPRALMTADVFDPCWIYEQADLDGVRRLSVRWGSCPSTSSCGAMPSRSSPARLPARGALEVRVDGCAAA
jgi:hexosaminidase